MAGDEVEAPGTFVAWAARSQGVLLRLACLLTGDLHRAEDLVQDALVKVALRWDRLAENNPDAYARRVIARTNISWWRRHRRERIGPVPDQVLDGRDDADRRLMLATALSRLTPKQRAVLVLRFYDDLREAEVAAALGVSVGTVKSQTHAALKQLHARSPELAELMGGMDS